MAALKTSKFRRTKKLKLEFTGCKYGLQKSNRYSHYNYFNYSFARYCRAGNFFCLKAKEAKIQGFKLLS
jgi:hypothetical protein